MTKGLDTLDSNINPSMGSQLNTIIMCLPELISLHVKCYCQWLTCSMYDIRILYKSAYFPLISNTQTIDPIHQPEPGGW